MDSGASGHQDAILQETDTLVDRADWPCEVNRSSGLADWVPTQGDGALRASVRAMSVHLAMNVPPRYLARGACCSFMGLQGAEHSPVRQGGRRTGTCLEQNAMD